MDRVVYIGPQIFQFSTFYATVALIVQFRLDDRFRSALVDMKLLLQHVGYGLINLVFCLLLLFIYLEQCISVNDWGIMTSWLKFVVAHAKRGLDQTLALTFELEGSRRECRTHRGTNHTYLLLTYLW